MDRFFDEHSDRNSKPREPIRYFDFSSWIEGGWILGSPLPYAPGVGFFGNGDVWAEGSYDADDEKREKIYPLPLTTAYVL